MPGTRDSEFPHNWFESCFGFEEGNLKATKAQFTFGRGLLSCRASGRIHQVGSFEALTLGQLRTRYEEEYGKAVQFFYGAGGLTFENVIGDTWVLHKDPANTGAVFQANSLYNCLESVPTGSGPEAGLTQWARSPTQGVACALSCPAATLWRCYFANCPPKAVDCLKTIGEFVGNDTEGYWTLRKGFLLPRTPGSIGKLSARIASDEAMAEEVKQRLGVGVHWDTEVWGTHHTVCQVFCSGPAVSLAKSEARASDWQGFARALLDAAFDATLTAAAVLAAQRQQRVRVFLTLVGGGMLGCRREWITDAIERALHIHDMDPLDVRLVHFSELPHGEAPRLKELEAGRLPAAPSGSGKANQHRVEATELRVQQGDLAREMTSSSESEVALLTRTFRHFDSNGDGVVDRREFIQMLQLVDRRFFNLETIDKLLNEADADGDGVVQYAEFVQWLFGEDETLRSSIVDIFH